MLFVVLTLLVGGPCIWMSTTPAAESPTLVAPLFGVAFAEWRHPAMVVGGDICAGLSVLLSGLFLLDFVTRFRRR